MSLQPGPGVSTAAGRSVVLAGQTVTYRVDVLNRGTIPVTNVTLANEAFLDVFDSLGNLVRASLGPANVVIALVPPLWLSGAELSR